MEVRTAICPLCSGAAKHWQPVTKTWRDCRLCDGVGFITPAVEDAFFDCARTQAAAPCAEKIQKEGPWL